MRFFKPVYTLSFIFLATFSGSLNAAQDVEFSVKASRDRMEFGSILSTNAELFTTKGSSQVGIYKRNPYTRLGSVCCHEDLITEEFFLKDQLGNDQLLQVITSHSISSGYTSVASIYSTEGHKLHGPKKISSSKDMEIYVDRDKKHFSVIDVGKASIYDAELTSIKEHVFSVKSDDIKLFSLSNSVRSVLVGYSGVLMLVDLNSGHESNVDGCSVSDSDELKAASFGNAFNSFFIVSQSGKSCLIDEGHVKDFKIQFKGELLAVYASGMNLYVLTADSIKIIDSKSLYDKGLFEIRPYYEGKYGEQANVQPSFSRHEFDSHNNIFYLSGGGNTGTFFEVKVVNK